MLLQSNTLLFNGKYRIVKPLGQGGFGITYLAEEMASPNTAVRKVAVKEFFMKDYCDRQGNHTQVTLGTQGNRDMVERYKQKFLKEARTIARFKHPNIVKVYDVFEENNTAYYVMEYLDGQSLTDLIQAQGPLSEQSARYYFNLLLSAVECVHESKVNHLDIKPSNVMLRSDGQPVLIDFGLAKNYDEKTGGQTSTTPIGVSEGFSPPEQYNAGGVSKFSPETDVYALGATLYYLLTGQVPTPSINRLSEGMAELPNTFLWSTRTAVTGAMRLRRSDRSTIENLKFLMREDADSDDDEDTDDQGIVPPVYEVVGEVTAVEPPMGYAQPVVEVEERKRNRLPLIIIVVLLVIALGVLAFLLTRSSAGGEMEKSLDDYDTTEVVDPIG